MLKLFPLFLIIFPFSFVSAQETSTLPSQDEANTFQNNNQQLFSGLSSNTPRTSEYYFSQCYRNVPPVTEDKSTLPLNQVPVHINAKTIHSIDDTVTYQDDVKLTQGIKYLAADKLTYFKTENRATAEGSVNYIDGNITLKSDLIETQLNSEQTRLKKADFQFHGRGGRGNAQQIYDNGADLYEFNASTFSACPPGDNTWTIDSTTLYLDTQEDVGSAYNAVLRIKDIPVFYFPYITYPLSDKRKTGLLFPSFERTHIPRAPPKGVNAASSATIIAATATVTANKAAIKYAKKPPHRANNKLISQYLPL